jgi:hypothetical protein
LQCKVNKVRVKQVMRQIAKNVVIGICEKRMGWVMF